MIPNYPTQYLPKHKSLKKTVCLIKHTNECDHYIPMYS